MHHVTNNISTYTLRNNKENTQPYWNFDIYLLYAWPIEKY